MVRTIKHQYEDARKVKDKGLIRDLIWKNSLLKKYWLGHYAEEVTGVKRPEARNKKNELSMIKQVVTEFFHRDTNSRVKAGKKSNHHEKRAKEADPSPK